MQSQRELSTFALSPAMRGKLTAAGFLTVEDLHHIKPSELSKELGTSAEDALEILQTVFPENTTTPNRKMAVPKSVTALELLYSEQSLPSILTFSEEMDTMLGGGVPLAKITEFCGAPGIGKTQICMQLCVDVQIRECFGGLGGEAVYIDTEGSFIVERLADIARATTQHCQHIASMDKSAELKEEAESFTLEKILSGIYCFRCHDYVELLATIHLLPKFINQHPKVKLVVIDSIAFHFRHDFEDLSLRTRLLTSLAQSFIKMATEFKLAVVLTNQMTTRFRGSEGASSSHLIPALGESWAHASTIRVILYWDDNHRYALLYKSPSKKEAVVKFQITMGGIRDVVSNSNKETSEDCSDNQPAKRQKVS
ncbi:DNA repair protein RAD51 homolog 3-like [Gigantopelta aegis]|uniref:DNA repair protein RAD51 homolog 3-like n=1 Tax=Gigantopelta aegis TaxID=1735272 RepID=UPI001B88DCEA|nr:DNA repair protein RAD51 homolog 3-like [Gigantopelta aegis]XP_041349753.1 DNA repair protein RAD51 homolog 3-like [Gigantopelta aegis]XP_041349754.1 DNA repair protein RAD51 homolog 3-like [Gigantopelta aegis]XP_041349755.1 DNA repair protein RAD51 homolog 3-like [Gigantopelta aegis]XP_041349756.1 DNA repair protein RAD51 homolog 3-like [Gigantopelta aegis]